MYGTFTLSHDFICVHILSLMPYFHTQPSPRIRMKYKCTLHFIRVPVQPHSQLLYSNLSLLFTLQYLQLNSSTRPAAFLTNISPVIILLIEIFYFLEVYKHCYTLCVVCKTHKHDFYTQLEGKDCVCGKKLNQP